MKVELVNSSIITSTSIFYVPLIVCTSISIPIIFVVECHIMLLLSHKVVLGMDWLIGAILPLIGIAAL